MHNASARSALMISDRGSRLSALLSLEDAFAVPSRHEQMPAIPVVSRCIAGIQLDCPLVFLLRGGPVPGI